MVLTMIFPIQRKETKLIWTKKYIFPNKSWFQKYAIDEMAKQNNIEVLRYRLTIVS